MSDDKTNPDEKTVQPKPKKTLGREEMFDVFKAGGEAELFARPAQKKHAGETETRTGPSIHHQIHDAIGPSIRNESTDATGPSIDHRLTDSEGPSVNRTEIVDAEGPTIAHQMNDGAGPIIRKAEIVDAEGPTIAHQMNDGAGPIIRKAEIVDAGGPTIGHQISDGAGPIIKKAEIVDADGPVVSHPIGGTTGPVIKRSLANTSVKLPTTKPLSSPTKTNLASSEHQPENTPPTEQAHRVDTFSIQMAQRIAKMKSAQKETREKMDELEASTHVMQANPNPKGKK